MSEHAWHLSLSLDPLIAAARTRARQRRVLLAASLLMLVGGGLTLALGPLGVLRSSPLYRGPYEPGGMFTGVPGPPPVVSQTSLQAVSAASGNDAWIVGSVAWHWDGHVWRSFPLPVKNNFDLWSVAAPASDDAWAVGRRGVTRNHALIEHWNGSGWSVARLPSLGASMLYGVSTGGPRSAWAVGATFHPRRKGRYQFALPLVLHWNGSSWRKQSLPWTQHGLILDEVVATGPSAVWVASSKQDALQSRLEYWNGTRWRHVHAPFGSNDALVGFSASGWNDAWAVGSYARGGNRAVKYSHALAAHWNGHRWQITPIPDPPGNNNSAALMDVAAAGPDNVWALGESQRLDLHGDNALSSTGPTAYFVHWDGRQWSVMPGAAPEMSEGWPALTVSSDGSAWAIGDCLAANVVLRWTNGTWAVASHPSERWRYAFRNARRLPGPLPSCSPRG